MPRSCLSSWSRRRAHCVRCSNSAPRRASSAPLVARSPASSCSSCAAQRLRSRNWRSMVSAQAACVVTAACCFATSARASARPASASAATSASGCDGASPAVAAARVQRQRRGVVGRHRRAVAQRDRGEPLAHRGQCRRIVEQGRDAGDDGVGPWRHGPAVHAVDHALGEAPDRGGEHRHAQRLQLAQRVAPGLGHAGRDQGQVRRDPGHVRRQFVARVVEFDVHARAAEPVEAAGAGAEQVEVAARGQRGDHLAQEFSALAALYPPQHQHARLAGVARRGARRPRSRARRGSRGR